MVRVKRGNVAAKRRKKYLKLSKRVILDQIQNVATLAGEQVKQSLNFAYIGRRLKKRNFRRIWIYRINAASRVRNNMYSQFIGCLRNLDIFLDRKNLSMIAFTDLSTFNVIERESHKSELFKK